MKKVGKLLLIISISLVLLCALIVGIMFLTKACPPQGPCPVPPWCNENKQVSSIEEPASSLTSVPLTMVTATMVDTSAAEVTSTPGPIFDYYVQVSVPYWSVGDIYLGVGENPTFQKLEKINEVTYEGMVKLPQYSQYFYTRGTSATSSSTTFTAEFPAAFDAVSEWQDQNKTFPIPGFQKGMTLGGSHWREEEYQNLDWALDKASEYGVTHILIIPVAWVYPDNQGSELKMVYFGDPESTTDPRFTTAEWGWWGLSLSDDQIREIAQKANERGMNVVLKPHLDVWDGSSRGAINPSDIEAFFTNYSTYIAHYAELAQEINADVFVVGTELDSVSQSNGLLAQRGFDVTEKWQTIIEKVREVYKGKITYSVSCFGNCSGPSHIMFWDSLDFIGFEPYFAVTQSNNPTLDELKQGFISTFDKFAKPLSEKYGKKIILTEVNAYSFDGVNTDPIAMFTSPEDYPVDKQEQSDYYEALFQSIVDLPYIDGTYPWPFWLYMGERSEYERIVAEESGHRDNITSVLAGQVVKKWYSEISP